MPSPTAVHEALEARATAREVASAAQIGSVLDRLAAEVTAALGERLPVLLPVMHGGIFTAVELARRLDFPHELDYVHLSRYGEGLEGGEIDWCVPPRDALRDRHVLVLDDVLDEGKTLSAVLGALAQRNAARIYSLVLVEKARQSPRPAPDFVGLRIENAYVFGCGMDYKGFWRNLPALYAVT